MHVGGLLCFRNAGRISYWYNFYLSSPWRVEPWLRGAEYGRMVFPSETENYLPRIIDIKLVIEQLEQLGLEPPTYGKVQEGEVVLDDTPLYLTDIADELESTADEISTFTGLQSDAIKEGIKLTYWMLTR